MAEPEAPCAVIIEDDALSRQVLVEAAQIAGYRTVVAADGSELPRLLGAAPEVLLLDLAMSGVNGMDVIRALGSAGFAGRVVIVSGHDAPILTAARSLAELLGLRVVAVLQKPVRFERLLALLEQPAAA